MYFSHFSTLAAFTLLVPLVVAASGRGLGERAVCIEDAYLLALQDFSAEASPFCSSYISIPAVTETVATSTPVVYVHAISTPAASLVGWTSLLNIRAYL